ncbi:unnamed protein product [Kluyveromyces dobzhanskii CBS 2104]|uniref:WGS project CCBQ000000000 data, contig 00015 n=1 Tax=Kluyveromyces dobzhanskii CBS 2104 TaxID=1427455 RepID=A0A0A8LAY0_9SACH|nr:unnamed protein product [Kluyveromyces dobzhanskii CBS 2104]
MNRNLVSIVSGGTRGIGSQIRDELLRRGHSVIFIGSTEDSVNRNQPQINLNQGQFVKGISINFQEWPTWVKSPWHQVIREAGQLATELQSDDLMAGIDKKNYRLDTLVNCAGITQTKSAIKTGPGDMASIMNVNFMSSVSLTQLVIKQMIRNSTVDGKRGRIVNIASILGDIRADVTVPGTAIYSASKAAVIQYNRVLSEELARWKIDVQTISPALVESTDMIQTLDHETLQKLRQRVGNGRLTTIQGILAEMGLSQE